MSSSDIFEASTPATVRRTRVCAISFSLMRSESVPKCTFREFEGIEVPMWPGITTEHLICGAFSRRSLISASVNPFCLKCVGNARGCENPQRLAVQKRNLSDPLHLVQPHMGRELARQLV